MQGTNLFKAEVTRILPQLPTAQKDMWEKASDDQKPRIEQALVYLRHGIAGEMLLEGPTAEAVAYWILGSHPTELAKGLTHREASSWLRQSEHTTPTKWLWAQVVEEHEELREVSSPRPLGVIRWLQETLRYPERKGAALRHRTGIMGEAVVGGRMIDRLDEIKECDLHASPVRTLEAAQQRLIDEEWDGENELTPEQKWHANLPEGITVLRHYLELRQEGVEMRHCAVSYARDIADGQCTMFSIRVGKIRSTAEMRGGEIRQHVGFSNEPPPEECKSLVAEMCKEAPWRQRDSS